MFVIRAAFWISVVALFAPHGQDFGIPAPPGPQGEKLQAIREMTFATLSRVRADIAEQKLALASGTDVETLAFASPATRSAQAQPRGPRRRPPPPPRQL